MVTNRKQLPLDRFVKHTVTSYMAQHITKLISSVVVRGLHPITLVEGNHFRKLINELAPGYELPSRYTFTRKMENLYASQHLKKKLCSNLHISLTTDMWASNRIVPFWKPLLTTLN